VSWRICTVGLTGGLASGKSTAARLLAGRGAAVLDADAVVHELYAAGGAGAAAVRDLFGADVLAADGSVDRARLAALITGDPSALGRLNRAVHPLVRRRVAAWLEDLAAAAEPPPVAVIEAALLVETGSYRAYDLLAVVWCRPEQQLARALARGVPEARARALLAAQAPIGEKRALADVVIDNSGPPEALAGEVARAWETMLARCRKRVQTAGGSSHSVR